MRLGRASSGLWGCRSRGRARHCAARGHPAQPETGVGDDDGRPGPPAGVHGHGQLDPGRHQQRDPLPGLDTVQPQTRGQIPNPLGPGRERTTDDGCPVGAAPRPPWRRVAQRGRRAVPAAGPRPARSTLRRRRLTSCTQRQIVPAASGCVLGHQVRWPADTAARRRAAAVDADRAGSGREDGIAGPPDQQRRDVGERGQPGRPPVQGRRLGWSGSSGMSATKSPTALRRPGRAYGPANARWTAAGSAGRDSAVAPRTKAGVRTHTSSRSAVDRASRINAGGAAVAGWCTAGVGQHDPRQLVAVRQGPAERDRAAPVVGDSDDRAGQLQGGGQPAEVVDPLASVRGGSVRSDQPMPSWSSAMTRQPGRRRGEEPTPQVGPGRDCRARTA